MASGDEKRESRVTRGVKNLTTAAGLAPDSTEGERRSGASLGQGEMCRRSRGLWVIQGHRVKLARSNSKRRKKNVQKKMTLITNTFKK